MENHSKNMKHQKNYYSVENQKEIKIPNYIKIKMMSNQNYRLQKRIIIEKINSNITSSHDSADQSIINNNLSIRNNILIRNRLQDINIFPYYQEFQKTDYMDSLSVKYISPNDSDVDEKRKFNYNNKYVSSLKKFKNLDSIKFETKIKQLHDIVKDINKKPKNNKIIFPKINSNVINASQHKKNKYLINKKNNRDRNLKKIENKTNESNFLEPIKINYIYKKVRKTNKDGDFKDREKIKIYDSNNCNKIKDADNS